MRGDWEMTRFELSVLVASAAFFASAFMWGVSG